MNSQKNMSKRELKAETKAQYAYIKRLEQIERDQGAKLLELEFANQALEARLALAYDKSRDPPTPKEHWLSKPPKVSVPMKTLAQRTLDNAAKKAEDWEERELHIPDDNGVDSDGGSWFIDARQVMHSSVGKAAQEEGAKLALLKEA